MAAYSYPTYKAPTTGGLTSGQGTKTPTYYGSNVWDTTSKTAASPWGGTSQNNTYTTGQVRPSNQGTTPIPTTNNPAPPPGTPMGQQPGTPSPGSSMGTGYGIGNDYWNPGGTTGGSQATGAQPVTGWGMPDASWQNLNPQAVANYAQIGVPMSQLQQNSYQYGQDFNENQRRWNEQFGWTQSNDTFNQNLASQQQASAQQIAQWQQNNWGQQFGLDSEMARGNLQLGQTQAAIDSAWKAGQLNNTQTELAQQDWYQRNMIGIQGTQNAIDSAWKAGQLSNTQRELALAELTQKQNDAFKYSQLQYQSDLQREGYKNQITQANINAFGRAQTPKSRWIRSW
jgi:hypothetical protein